MLRRLKKIWHSAFLEERPSINLSLFRIAVALTVGLHVIPTLLHLEDNYLIGSFREKNTNFFTAYILELVDKSPDAVIVGFVVLFYVSLLFFLFGFLSQVSCILMTLACYYFYALNSAHIGTLSWDILLVTLFMMCVTGYHGDYFSLDALRKPSSEAYRRMRPYFVQRLLQFQLAFTYFYTALGKISSQGNWITENPMYFLMNSSEMSVVKHFPFRGLIAGSGEFCYALGISIIVMEFLVPFLLFIRKTRIPAIGIGFIFHILLISTLHVPTIFFFLFPPMFLLFISPKKTLAWIDRKRVKNESKKRDQLLYDGKCNFCTRSVKQLETLDLFSETDLKDFHAVGDLSAVHFDLTKERLTNRIQLVTHRGKLYEGFYAFRYLTRKLPQLWILAPVFHLPGSGMVGSYVYDFIARNRTCLVRPSS